MLLYFQTYRTITCLDEKIINGITQALDTSKMALLLAARNTLDTNGVLAR